MKLLHEKYILSTDENGHEVKNLDSAPTEFDDMTTAKTAFEAIMPAANEEFTEHLCDHDEPETVDDGNGNKIRNEFKGGCKVNTKRLVGGKSTIVRNTLRNMFLSKKESVVKDKAETDTAFNSRKEAAADDLSLKIKGRLTVTSP